MCDNKPLYSEYQPLIHVLIAVCIAFQFESSYLSILSAVKGSPQEKQLCSQFISKFFVHFPNHYDTAIDALLDLCEDDDINVRLFAIFCVYLMF
jgi:hypothetical protein